jgi:hypothetical protein
MTSLETERAQNFPVPVDRYMSPLLMNIKRMIYGQL